MPPSGLGHRSGGRRPRVETGVETRRWHPLREGPGSRLMASVPGERLTGWPSGRAHPSRGAR